ncbi:MAG: hypothetical protein ACRCSP_08620 [Rhodoglobus sp.]
MAGVAPPATGEFLPPLLSLLPLLLSLLPPHIALEQGEQVLLGELRRSTASTV